MGGWGRGPCLEYLGVTYFVRTGLYPEFYGNQVQCIYHGFLRKMVQWSYSLNPLLLLFFFFFYKKTKFYVCINYLQYYLKRHKRYNYIIIIA